MLVGMLRGYTQGLTKHFCPLLRCQAFIDTKQNVGEPLEVYVPLLVG